MIPTPRTGTLVIRTDRPSRPRRIVQGDHQTDRRNETSGPKISAIGTATTFDESHLKLTVNNNLYTLSFSIYFSWKIKYGVLAPVQLLCCVTVQSTSLNYVFSEQAHDYRNISILHLRKFLFNISLDDFFCSISPLLLVALKAWTRNEQKNSKNRKFMYECDKNPLCL